MLRTRERSLGIIALMIAFLFLPSSGHSMVDRIPLEISINSDKSIYEIGAEIWINVTIRNDTTKSLIISGPGFEISSDRDEAAIHSPVRFVDNTFDDTPNEQEELVLQPYETKSLKYNLYNLKWGNIFSSQWASKEFTAYAVPGKHSVFFTMSEKFKGLCGKEGYSLFKSRIINIEIVAAGPWPSLRIPKGYVSRNNFIIEFALTNYLKSDIKIWERWNSWGAYNWWFELKDKDGKIIQFINPQVTWTKNIPTIQLIKPHECFVLRSQLLLEPKAIQAAGSYDNKKKLNVFVPVNINDDKMKEISGKFEIRGVYRCLSKTTTRDPFEKEWEDIWQGETATRWYQITILQ